eukprot:755515-Hanusia_phi.AAC.2
MAGWTCSGRAMHLRTQSHPRVSSTLGSSSMPSGSRSAPSSATTAPLTNASPIFSPPFSSPPPLSSRAQTARVTKVALDELTLSCVWSETAKSQLGPVTCTLQGLVLQGALYTGGYLAEAKFDTPTVVSLPLCTIAFVPRKEEDLASSSTVEVPVYERDDRSHFLMRLRMSCKANEQDRWVLSGAAIFISAD